LLSDNSLRSYNFRSSSSLLFFLTFLLVFKIFLIKGKISFSLIRLKESSHMEDSIAFSNQSNIIKERDKQIDGGLRLFFGQVGNEEFFSIFLDPERGTGLRSGSKDNVGEGKDLTLSLLDCASAEGKVLTLRQDFSKEH
jgi:hypothetical protein